MAITSRYCNLIAHNLIKFLRSQKHVPPLGCAIKARRSSVRQQRHNRNKSEPLKIPRKDVYTYVYTRGRLKGSSASDRQEFPLAVIAPPVPMAP